MGVTPSTSSNQQVNDLCFTQCKELVHRLPKEGRGGLDIPVTDLIVDAGNLQEYWTGLPYPPPGHFPDPVIEPVSLTSPVLAGAH